MPIIVDEIVISVEVTNQAAGGAASAPEPSGGKQEIVSECVERVLEILDERKER